MHPFAVRSGVSGAYPPPAPGPAVELLTAFLLGIVEGLTEFLPVSSTGHLILASHFLGAEGVAADTFDIFIQLGAVLAVAWEYRASLVALVQRARTDEGPRSFLLKILLAFVPAAGVGLLFSKSIKAYLFGPIPVAWALIGGGIVMLALEHTLKRSAVSPEASSSGQDETEALASRLTWKQALGIGLAQCLALIPGVSRSASTILGGMVAGLSRAEATAFSFYLALPTLGAATLYDLLKNVKHLSAADVAPFAVGLVTAFGSALLVIRAFLRFVRGHDFTWLAVYRILIGVLVLVLLG